MSDLGDPAAGERRRRLLGVKLRALVADHIGAEVTAEPVSAGISAALSLDGGTWILVDGPADRALGASVAWALRHGPASLDLVVEVDGGRLARRAEAFDLPIRVWFPEGRTLLPVVPTPVADPPDPPAEHLALLSLIESAGADPHVERGVVTGEVRGLEVCRVVDEPTTGNFIEPGTATPLVASPPDHDGGVLLEVGVGANDREAFQMLHGHVPTVEALAGVVSSVAEHRSVDAQQHPLNRMAPERFVRWQVEQDPSMLGLRSIQRVDPPVDRLSMKHVDPCVARGVDLDGRSVCVVFSVGVDLDLSAFVADVLVHLDEPVDRVLVALREPDRLPIVGELLATLRQPIEIVTPQASAS